MKKFKNLKVGCIEEVTNEFLIEQYEKHPEMYEEIKEEKSKKKEEK